MNGDALIFLAAGAITLFASRRGKDEVLDQIPASEKRDPHPCTTQLYTEPSSTDGYFEYLMRSGARPVKIEYGAKGLPVYIYSRPGGRSFYKVYNPKSTLLF